MANKQRLAQYILQVTGESIDPNSLFDIQVKRIHEYKRQLLNILGAIYRYKKLKVLFQQCLLFCVSHAHKKLDVILISLFLITMNTKKNM